MQLRELMSTGVVTIESTQSASAAWARMRKHRIQHLVVTDDGALVGMISERDLSGRNGDSIRKGRTVQDLMSSRVVRATPAMTLRQAANLMRGRLIGSLPVLEGDRLVGIVTATDVLEALGRRSSRPTRRPRDAPSGSAQIAAYIRAANGGLGPDDRAYIRRKLGVRLGKYARSIERVSLRTEDVNGPRGGIDQVCRIKVVLRGLPSVVIERRDVSLRAAVDGALAGAERTVQRAVRRRRMKPLKRVA